MFHLVYQRSHAVDACVAGGDDYHVLSLLGQGKGLFGTFAFALHAGVDALTSRLQVRFDELEVILIAHHNISLADSFDDCRRDVFLAAWPYAGDGYLSFFHYFIYHLQFLFEMHCQ